jgi:polyisoprenoid-binding protein YceI
MSRWIFEPGHTEVEFRARHMMVTWMRGLFKDIHGAVQFDPDRPMDATFQGEIDAARIWTGEPTRDAHLRSADFLDVDHHPKIVFAGRVSERTGDMHAKASVEVTIRGVTRPVVLAVAYLGQWETPFWVGEENRGTLRRIGFEATTTINRHDFGVSWQDHLPRGGVGGQQRSPRQGGRGGDPPGRSGAHRRDRALPVGTGAPRVPGAGDPRLPSRRP